MMSIKHVQEIEKIINDENHGAKFYREVKISWNFKYLKKINNKKNRRISFLKYCTGKKIKEEAKEDQ